MKKLLSLSSILAILCFVSNQAYSQYCTPTIGTNWGYAEEVKSTGATVDVSKNTGSTVGYNNYTSTNDTIGTELSQTFTVSIKHGYSAGLWIDWNADSDFTDPGEAIFVPTTYNGSTIITENHTVTVPANASTGRTRMRVLVGYYWQMASCGYSTYTGEVEDYTVFIKPPEQLDAEVTSLDPLNLCTGTQNINVKVSNRGLDSIASITLAGSIGTTTFGPTTFSGMDIKFNEDTTLNLGTFNFTGGSSYNLEFYSTSPNGGTDLNTANDTFAVNGYMNALSGTYTIGGTSPDFGTIDSARMALYERGVCGPVTFNIRSGTYNGQITFNGAIPGASGTNHIRFRPDPANSAGVTLSHTSNYVLGFDGGVAHISIDSLNLVMNSFANVVRLIGNNDSITFNGNNFTGYNTTSSSSAYACIFDANGNNTTNLTVKNNDFFQGSTSLWLYGQGSGSGNAQDGFVFENNTVREYGYYGIYTRFCKNGSIHGNTFTNQGKSVGSAYGIYGYYNYFVDVTANQVAVFASSWTRAIYWYYCDGSTSDRTLVANNMFSKPSSSTSTAGYDYLWYCDYTDWVNNSWYGNYSNTSSSYGIVRLYYGTSVRWINNSLHNDGTGYALRIYGTPTTHSNCNYYNANNTNRVFPTTGGTSITYLNPGYLSTTDLHIGSPALNAKGTPFAGVTVDIDGEARDTTNPDVGADEVVFVNNDAGVTMYAMGPPCPGSNSISVKVKNFGLLTLDSVTVNWSVAAGTGSPVAQTPFKFTSSIAPGGDTSVTIGSFTFASGSDYTIYASTSLPNGVTDGKMSNDSIEQTYALAMSGTYTIGGTSPDYSTIDSAIMDLYSKGVCGPAVFNIRSGTYSGQIDFNGAIPGADSTNNIRFRTDPASSTMALLTNNNDYTIKFTGGAGYISFDSLRLETTSFANVVELAGPNTNISFNGNEMKGYQTTSSFNGYAVVYDYNGVNTSNFVFINNKVTNGGIGIYMRGAGTTSQDDGFIIENNTFTDVGYWGIYLYYMKNGSVKGNTIVSGTDGNFKSNYGAGIYAQYAYFTDFVGNDITQYNSGQYSYGMYFRYCDGNTSNRSLIANNMVKMPDNSTSTANYNYFYYCDYNDIVFNSFYGKRASTSTNGGLVYLYYGTSVTFQNNVVFNDAAGYALDLLGTHTRSYNNLYGGGGTRNITGGTQGANGVNVDPDYISPSDLHTFKFDLYRVGTPFTGVTDDIDGDARDTLNPCLGADEFYIPGRDASPVEVVYSPSCPGTHTMRVRVENKGLDTLTSVSAAWSVSTNGGTPSVKSPISWSGSIPPSGDTVLTLGNLAIVDGSTYDIKVYTYNVNGIGDEKTENDTTNRVIETAMNGVYTVGGLTPDYTTLTDAVAALNSRGVCGPVTMEVRPGTYTGRLYMEEIEGVSAVNTITWMGTSPTNTTISYATTGQDYATIELNGTDHMTFKHFTIQNTANFSYSKNFWLSNNADNITIDSCVITQSNNTSYQSTGIAVSSANNFLSTGTRVDGLTVSNCTINGMDYGIAVYGNSNTDRCTNVNIENNTFTNIDAFGLYLYWYLDSVTVKNNDLSDFGGGNYGIYCRYVRNFEISGNSIVASGSYAMYLYQVNYVGASTNNIGLVYNNMIAHTGTTFALYIYYANYLDLYHNSIRANGSYACYSRYGNSKDIRNNIFYSGNNYAFYRNPNSTTYITTMDNNLYYRGNSTLVAYDGGGRTLAGWQTLRTTWNQNSAEGDPKFQANDDLRIANGRNADSLGATGLGINMDIFGTMRDTSAPDAGAHEFDYQPIDGHLVALTRPTGKCLSATDTLEFAVVNVGGDTIQLGTNGVNIAWSVTGPSSASGTDAANIGSVPPGDTVYVKTANAIIDLSKPGKYNVTAYITSTWDKFNENDTLMEELSRDATESITAVKDTTVYYKDSLGITAISDQGDFDVQITEICQWAGSSTGSPVGGRPSWLTADDYVEITTGGGSQDLSGWTLEVWSSSFMRTTYTLPQGAVTSPQGTMIIGTFSGGSDNPSQYYYAGASYSHGSTTSSGRILKDPDGNIVDVVAYSSYTFPGAAGTAGHWTGTNVAGSSSWGIRLTGPDLNNSTNWSKATQDPNTKNSGVNVPVSTPPNFRWTYNGSVIDTVLNSQAGPWTVKGTKDYIASFVSPCTGDTIKDTASIIAYSSNLIVTADDNEYYSYPLSQSSGVMFTGNVENLGDSLSNIRVFAQLSGSAFGDTLASAGLPRFDDADFTVENNGISTTTGMKTITYYPNTTDDFPGDDTAHTMVDLTDSVMARENGTLPLNVASSVYTKLGQRFTVYTQDSVTGAQVYVKTSFPGDKFKVTLYALNGNTVGSMLNESNDLTLLSTTDTGLKTVRFNCLSVLSPGDYMVAVEQTSTVFSSGLGANQMNATANSAFGNNGSFWTTLVLGGNPFNMGIRLIFGSYDFPTFAEVDPACISGDKFLLSGGMPAGGSYFGTGVSNDTLDPTALSVGSNAIYYRVLNSLGCPDTVPSNIEIKAEPTVSSVFQNLTSCVADTASISVSASGGFGTFRYSINGGTSYVSTSTFDSLGSGSYTVVVQDSVCTVTDTTYVATPPGAPTAPNASGGAVYCDGDALAKLQVSTTTAGTAGTFKWYTDGSLTQLLGTGDSIAAHDSIATLTYFVIEDRAGCISATDTTSVTVNALPVVSNSALSNRCTNYDTLTLNTGTPAGGVYSGSGVSNGVFDPDAAGAGTHVITYSYTDGNNCTNSDTASVTIYQAPVVALTALDSACTNTPSYTLTGGTPTGGSYSGFGVSGGIFDANTAGIGVHAIKYRVTNTNCVDSATQNIRVNLAPVVTISSMNSLCLDAPAMTLSNGAPSGGTYSGSGISGGVFTAMNAGVGTHSVKYVFVDSKNCRDSASTNVEVDSLPVATFTTLNSVCTNTPSFSLSQGSASPAGGAGTYFGPGVSSPSFNAGTAGAGLQTLGYAYLDTNGCRDTAYQTIQVDTVTMTSWSTLSDLCIDEPTFAMTSASPLGGVYKGSGVLGGTQYRADSAGVGVHFLWYVFTNGNGCMDSTSQPQRINALPTVGVSMPANWCLNAAPIQLSSGTPTGGQYTINSQVDSVFNRTVAGVDTVIYTYTDANSCTNTATSLVAVDTVPVVTFGTVPDICHLSPALYSFVEGMPSGGMYYGNDVVTNNRYRATTVGTDTITYIFTDANNCTDSAHSTILVNPLPTVGITAQADICENTPSFALSGGSPAGGSYTGQAVVGGTNYLAANFGNGTDNVTYVYTDGNSCTDSATTTIVVHKVTPATVQFLGFTCDNSTATVLGPYGLPNGGVFSGSGVSGNNFDPAAAGGAGTYSLKYVYTNSNNCQDSATGDIIVEAAPNVSIMGDTVGCGNNPPTLYTNLTNMTYRWSFGARTDTARPKVSGSVWVKVTDPGTQELCFNYDTINVEYDAVCVGIDEALAGTSVRYFPNPNNGVFNYEIAGFEGLDVKVAIHSMSGQIVHEEVWENVSAFQTGRISAEVYESGVYFITLSTSRGNVMHRITINH